MINEREGGGRQHATKSVKARIFTILPSKAAETGYIPMFWQTRWLIKCTSLGRMVFIALQHNATGQEKSCDRFSNRTN
jgi:hypothetical protein